MFVKFDVVVVLVFMKEEVKGLKDFYEIVFLSSDYNEFMLVYQKKVKIMFVLIGVNVKYDYQGILFGEDNLGVIYNWLIGFQCSFKKGQVIGNGVFCIDEFESSLYLVV